MYGHVIEEIRFLSSTVSCSFLHVNRRGNKLAHPLARRAVLSADTDVWLEDLPRDLDDKKSLCLQIPINNSNFFDLIDVILFHYKIVYINISLLYYIA